MGRACLRALRLDLRLCRIYGRRVPPRHREDRSGALPRIILLRALDVRLRGSAYEARHRHPRRARRAHRATEERRPLMLLTPDIVPVVVASGASARVEKHVAPRFRVGDRIRVRNHNPTTHTRLPGYLRGKLGTIEQDYGVFAFPDTHAHGLGDKPQHCYSVRFTARELWGPAASDRDTLRVDVFDDYMDLD